MLQNFFVRISFLVSPMKKIVEGLTKYTLVELSYLHEIKMNIVCVGRPQWTAMGMSVSKSHILLLPKENFVNFWHENERFCTVLCFLWTLLDLSSDFWFWLTECRQNTFADTTQVNPLQWRWRYTTIFLFWYKCCFVYYIDDSLQLRQQYYRTEMGPTVMITWPNVCMSDIQNFNSNLQWKSTKIAGYLLWAETMV